MRNYDPLTAEPYELQKTLGYKITGWKKNWARVELDLTDTHKNRQGFPHGGIYALLIDTAVAHSGSWVPETEPRRGVMTLSLTVNFVSVPKGTKLITEANCTGGGSINFFSDAEIRDELGNLIATGTATLKYRRRPNLTEDNKS